ncbi:MAG: hypothetical protein ACKN9V_07195 [Pseudomonadota bacterium]
MGQIIWQIKEAISKLIVVIVIGSVAYGSYTLYRKGAFRGGVGHASRVILKQIPYFGSRFRHFIGSGSRSSYSASSRKEFRRGRSKHQRKYSTAYRRIRRHRRH